MVAHDVREPVISNGDLNNTHAARAAVELEPDASYLDRTLAIAASEDDSQIRQAYRPFLLNPQARSSDWVATLELSTVIKLVEEELSKSGGDRLKVLVLYGSLRGQ